MKTNIDAIINSVDFKKLFDTLGYAYFTKGNYNLNIIGIRIGGRTCTNKFEDKLVVEYKNNNDKTVRKIYNITTKPGASYLGDDMGSVKGTAILVPNQYRGCWKIGYHKNLYKALVQAKPVKVYRDSNKNKEYDFDPQTIDTGVFGINIHKAGTHSYIVNNWSAGCQVFQDAADFKSFMALCQQQIDAGRGSSFTYTLINEEDLC